LQSRTVSIKIRYENFSTESGRETSSRPVSTLNELYEKIHALFLKKYQSGRGVRLIGAGLMNLESALSAKQSELFEEEASEKERHLEKTIFEINKKYPEAALKRGRSWLAGE
jgi:DNA polymerase-4